MTHKQTAREVDVPPTAIELAKRRTEFLFRYMTYGDTPMRMILASAYIQGMNDMFDALDNRRMLRKTSATTTAQET